MDLTYKFDNKNIRIVIDCNEPWFVSKDICNILNINENKSYKHLKTLPNAWKKKIQNMLVISDAGVATLTMTSHHYLAQKLQHWILNDVVPNLQKQDTTSKKVIQTNNVPKQEEIVKKVTIEDNENDNIGNFFGDDGDDGW